MDIDMLYEVIAKAKFKNLGITTDSAGSVVYNGWEEGVYEDFWSGPEKDVIGMSFAPVSHNYLYGWAQTPVVEKILRQLNENVALQSLVYETFAKMDALVGGHSTIIEYLKYMTDHGGPPYLLLVFSFQFRNMPESVYAMNLYFKEQAANQQRNNTWSMYAAPLLVGSQLYTFGWKRTLALWAVGVLVSEGAQSQLGKIEPFAGWSIITYMIYGQMMNETFEDRKLRTLGGGLRNLRGFAINAVGGYGAYNTLSHLYYDPAPFLQKSQRTGIHHGAHHIGLLLGFLMNRWTR